jgi:hypothetical protein
MTQTRSAFVVAHHEGATLGHQLASFRDIKEVEGTGKPYLLGISAKSEWETTIEVKALLEKHTPPGCRPAHRKLFCGSGQSPGFAPRTPYPDRLSTGLTGRAWTHEGKIATLHRLAAA